MKGIMHEHGCEVKMFGYCNVDFVGHANRRSTLGFVFSLESGPITWSSKRRDSWNDLCYSGYCVATSTLEGAWL